MHEKQMESKARKENLRVCSSEPWSRKNKWGNLSLLQMTIRVSLRNSLTDQSHILCSVCTILFQKAQIILNFENYFFSGPIFFYKNKINKRKKNPLLA